MHQEDNEVVEFQLDDQALHAFLEIVKRFPSDGVFHHEGIALLVQHGDPAGNAAVLGVLGAVTVVVAELVRENFRLVGLAATVRTGVDLHESNEIRIKRPNEFYDVLKIPVAPGKVSGPGHLSMSPGGIADIVK